MLLGIVPRMRASRGAGPRRLRREKRALKRSEMGWVGSRSLSHRNLSISGDDSKEEPSHPIVAYGGGGGGGGVGGGGGGERGAARHDGR